MWSVKCELSTWREPLTAASIEFTEVLVKTLLEHPFVWWLTENHRGEQEEWHQHRWGELQSCQKVGEGGLKHGGWTCAQIWEFETSSLLISLVSQNSSQAESSGRQTPFPAQSSAPVKTPHVHTADSSRPSRPAGEQRFVRGAKTLKKGADKWLSAWCCSICECILWTANVCCSGVYLFTTSSESCCDLLLHFLSSSSVQQVASFDCIFLHVALSQGLTFTVRRIC